MRHDGGHLGRKTQSKTQASSSSEHNSAIQMSEYFSNLSGLARGRYQQKVNLLGYDPYKLKKLDFSEDQALLPSVDYGLRVSW